MKQLVNFGPAAINSLVETLQKIVPKNIFLITGKASYQLSGAEAALTKILQPYHVHRFYKFEVNPKLTHVQQGLTLFRERKYDVIIAVGGGSVLDMGKLINIFAAQEDSPAEIVKGRKDIRQRGIPLIAIPTTSGSGSEATNFAVIYLGKTKYSIAHPYLLPQLAIVDPNLTHSMPSRVTAVTGMDALAQAIESFWCIHSTQQSQTYAEQAIKLIRDNLYTAVHKPSVESRSAMCKAAHLAGCAINITKTTAPHALSYTVTSQFGVPHGHAVGLTLGEFLVYNSQVMDKDAADIRGACYTRSIIQKLNKLLQVPNAVAGRDRISSLMQSIGLQTHLTDLGIEKVSDHKTIIENVNLARMKNNPRVVTESAITEIVKRII